MVLLTRGPLTAAETRIAASRLGRSVYTPHQCGTQTTVQKRSRSGGQREIQPHPKMPRERTVKRWSFRKSTERWIGLAQSRVQWQVLGSATTASRPLAVRHVAPSYFGHKLAINPTEPKVMSMR